MILDLLKLYPKCSVFAVLMVKPVCVPGMVHCMQTISYNLWGNVLVDKNPYNVMLNFKQIHRDVVFDTD